MGKVETLSFKLGWRERERAVWLLCDITQKISVSLDGKSSLWVYRDLNKQPSLNDWVCVYQSG